MDALAQWLLQGDAYISYRACLDLLGQEPNHPEVISARENMLEDPRIRDLIAGLQDWPGMVVSNHKSAGLPHHILNFLVDIGVRIDDPGMHVVADRILEHISGDGVIQSFINIPKAFGGSGEGGWSWMLCDAPLLLRGLICLGLHDHPRIQKAVDHLTGLVRDNGWPCAAASELSNFRGPGRKDDACPYATLIMVKLLAEIPGMMDNPLSRTGCESLLNSWEKRSEKHAYLFYMGTDFCKLKAPLVWFDILHATDVLCRFPEFRNDARLMEMFQIIKNKADAEGRYTPESIWTYWKDWEFGQKKVPSRWVTLLVESISKRNISFNKE